MTGIKAKNEIRTGVKFTPKSNFLEMILLGKFLNTARSTPKLNLIQTETVSWWNNPSSAKILRWR